MATTDRPRILFEPGRVRVSAKPTGGIKIGGGNPPPAHGGQGGGQGKGGGAGGRGVGRTAAASSSLSVLASAFGAIASARGQVPSPPDVAGITRLGLLTADGTASTMDFQSIPATYTSLQLVFWGRSAIAAVSDNLYVRFNNDSGANYDWAQTRRNSAAVSSNFNAADTNGIAVGIVTGATGTASLATAITVDIPMYAATAFFRCANVASYEQHGVTDATTNQMTWGGTWHDAANAINRVTLRTAAANITSGSICALYGIT